MSRFRTADEQPTAFSQARPERFELEDYRPPQDDGEIRPIDDAPTGDAGPSLFANVGYPHLKRR